jgi:hypothetical protein
VLPKGREFQPLKTLGGGKNIAAKCRSILKIGGRKGAEHF